MKGNNEVMEKNRFVKREQETLKSMMGERPGAPEEMRKFNAYMVNNGERAQEYARTLTEGLDKKAFPVK